jgi:hypothetical protein
MERTAAARLKQSGWHVELMDRMVITTANILQSAKTALSSFQSGRSLIQQEKTSGGGSWRVTNGSWRTTDSSCVGTDGGWTVHDGG